MALSAAGLLRYWFCSLWALTTVFPYENCNYSRGPQARRLDMPADRLKILREAFLKTMSDAEALAEAKKPAGTTTEERSCGAGQEIVDSRLEVIERAKKLLTQ